MRIGFFRGVLFALSVAMCASMAGAVELVPLTNAVWRFNQSSNLDGVNWTAPAYDDSSWASGPSLLAFEDNAAITPLRYTTLNDPRTAVDGIQGHAYYFRIHFNWPYATNNVTLRFSCRLDDCAVFYLNGVLLTNVGVNTPVTFASMGRLALNGGDATADEVFSIVPASLLTGDNVLAVEVHQTASTSTDIVWGARVEGDSDATPPLVTSLTPAPGTTVRSLTSAEVTFSEAVRNVDAADLLINSQPATNVVTTDQMRYTFSFPSPATGAVSFAFASGHGITDLNSNLFAGTNWSCTFNPNLSFPSGPIMTHRYDFSGNANDLVGTAHGTLQAGATITDGALVLNGSGAYLDLPDNMVTGYTSVTFETWALNSGSGGWARVWDFGNAAGVNMLLTWPSGASNLRVVFNVGTGEQQVNATLPANNQMLHIVFTLDASNHVGRLYVDGVQVGENTGFTLTPTDIGVTANDWLGRSQYNDPYFNGKLTEFRIYDSALTATQVQENFLAGPDAPPNDGPVNVARSPVDATVAENALATFSAVVVGKRPHTLQWFKNGLAIPGATSNTLTFTAAFADNSAVFQLWATNTVDSTVYSSASGTAILHVLADTNPPVLLRAANAGTNSVRVLFSETVTATGATNLSNYALTGPAGAVALTSATLSADGLTITLACGTLNFGNRYTLVVNGVRDRSAALNLIATNSSFEFTAAPFELTDVGSPSFVSQLVVTNGGYDFIAGGTGFGGTSDQFTFGFQNYNGNFDLSVRLNALSLSDAFARAGLMARDGLSTISAFAATWATPGPAGCFFQTRTSSGTTNGNLTGAFPVNYPYTWLRLRRVGNLFDGFASLDGATWSPLGSATIGMSTSVQVGFAVSANSTNASTTAAFRDFGTAVGVIVTNAPLPFEPMAPCTRRTGVVISEIMYNPPDDWSTNSLEFVEIHNPDMFDEEIGGWQFDGDINFTFPAGLVLRSGGYVVVARNPAAVQAFYGISGVLGPFTGNLPNGGGTVRVVNETGGRVLEVDYDNNAPWPVAADGAGHSLVLRRPSYGEDDPRAWGLSDVFGGSSGRADAWGTQSLRSVVINEFVANSDPPLLDFIELYNASTQTVDLSGAWLSDVGNTNKFRIPNGTVLGPRGFVSFDETALGFALDSEGEEIYLVNSNRTRVLDAVRFTAQALNVSRGRAPDGSPLWSELAAPTPGTNNSPPLRHAMVINEIMFRPISDSNDDEYVELYNRGTNTVNLAGWRLSDGISFTFPSNAVAAPGACIVVAENLTNLLARYSQLNGTNTFGDYNGALRNNGERLVLEMPLVVLKTNSHGVVTTNVSYIAVNEVTYRGGGYWGKWSDGGGSSLELIDPRADNRFAANWADSDESAKATWTTVDFTGMLDNGMGSANGTPNRFEFFLQGPGECLLDDLECLPTGGANLLTNPGFENGLTDWAFQGTHRYCYLETNTAFSGTKSLHVVATDRGDTGANRVRAAITTMTTGINGTIRAKVCWLKGSRDILFRVRGNWIEAPGVMNVPTNCGTPGLVNSRRAANVGPAIADTTHTPVLPLANQAVVVSARINDPDGIASATLRYRLDPSASYTDVAMRDDGTGGDALAGDGVYSATIPGQASGAMVAFYITANDGAAVPLTGLFPNDAPTRECLARWGETQPYGSIGAYRLWMRQSNIDYWNSREKNSNDPMDGTFACGNYRVIYNVGMLYSGSPWHAPGYSGPLGGLCDYELNFRDDERFLGSQDFVLNAQTVDEPFFAADNTTQSEDTAYWMGRKLGMAYNHKRIVRLFFNGQQRFMLYYDAQQPNAELVSQYYPDDDEGDLRKIEDWFEFDDAGSGFDIITATLEKFTTTGGALKPARYRWTWRPRAVHGSPNDFADMATLIEALNSTQPEPYTSASYAAADVDEWMRHCALQHMVGNWDTYGYGRGKNCFAYKPTMSPWRLLLWDVDICLGKASDGPTTPLFNNAEPVINRMYNYPPFVRRFWAALSVLVNGPMLPEIYGPRMDQRYVALLANGVPVQSPSSVATWIDARRNYILTQLPTPNFTTPATVNTTNLMVTLSGTAPVGVVTITVRGTAWPVTWTDVTHWQMTVPVDAGTNTYTVVGLDRLGNMVSGASNQVVIGSTAPPPDAVVGSVVINEIMYNPTNPSASYVEIFNRSSTTPFDLSGWSFNGLSYTFPAATILQPRSFLVLAKDRAAFATAYGTNVTVFDVFTGNLQTGNETLTLLKPGTPDLVISKVRYENVLPWPVDLQGRSTTASIQLIDPAQDISRPCNWATFGGGSRTNTDWAFMSVTATNSGAQSRLWIFLDTPGEVYLDDLALVSGSVPGVGSNYIRNAGFETNLSGSFIVSTNYSASARVSDFPHAGTNCLRVVCNYAPSVANNKTNTVIYQTFSPAAPANQLCTLSFWYRSGAAPCGLTVKMQFPSVSTNVNIVPAIFVAAYTNTPGATNFGTTNLPAIPALWINEIAPQNLTGPTNSAGQRTPWLELYNAGTNAVNLQGLYLATSYTNLTQWAFPAGAFINPGQFKTIFADGNIGLSTLTELHTSFQLPGTNGSIALARVRAGTPEVLDYINYASVPADYSYGSVPDGQPFDRQTMYYVTPSGTNDPSSAPLVVFINEWMASNTRTIANPVGGQYDDWFELYNPNAVAVDLTGWSLANSLTNVGQNVIPAGYSVPARGYLLVWADNKPERNSTNHPDLHVSFKLSKDGEAIALFNSSGRLVDSVVFGSQTSDVSQGRSPDGSTIISFMSAPSPRTVNQVLTLNGQVELEGYIGPSGNGTGQRVVTFAASDNFGTVMRRWDLTLNFAPSGTGNGVVSFTLTNAPAGTMFLSAKSAWHLRKKLVVVFNGGGQGTATFTGDSLLRGGDLDGSNYVEFGDYNRLATSWYTHDAAADINGNGLVEIFDYFILASRWYQPGDPE